MYYICKGMGNAQLQYRYNTSSQQHETMPVIEICLLPTTSASTDSHQWVPL